MFDPTSQDEMRHNIIVMDMMEEQRIEDERQQLQQQPPCPTPALPTRKPLSPNATLWDRIVYFFKN